MNWDALISTGLTFVTFYSCIGWLRARRLKAKCDRVVKIWERVGSTVFSVEDQAAAKALIAMCSEAADELDKDLERFNLSYWILSCRKSYNLPAIQNEYVKLRAEMIFKRLCPPTEDENA